MLLLYSRKFSANYYITGITSLRKNKKNSDFGVFVSSAAGRRTRASEILVCSRLRGKRNLTGHIYGWQR